LLVGSSAIRRTGIDLIRVFETDFPQQLHGSLPPLLRVQKQMRAQNLANLRTRRQHRIERQSRILRDQRDHAAADQTQFPLRQMQQIAAVDQNCAPRPGRIRRQQPQQRACQRAFSATGFSQYSDDFSSANVDCNAVQRANGVAAFGRVRNCKVPDLGNNLS
jgi:hypothetical protein